MSQRLGDVRMVSAVCGLWRRLGIAQRPGHSVLGSPLDPCSNVKQVSIVMKHDDRDKGQEEPSGLCADENSDDAITKSSGDIQ